MSGAVGSRPSFTFSGLPVLAEEVSFSIKPRSGVTPAVPRINFSTISDTVASNELSFLVSSQLSRRRIV